MFDRILILPTSVAPRTVAGPAPPPTAFGAARPLVPQPRIIRQPPPAAVQSEPEDVDDDAADQDPADDPPVPATRPAPPRFVRPGITPLGPEPQVVAEEPAEEDANDAPAAVTPTPTNPFGVPAGSSGRPGVITPAPQQPQQRPPGR
jgi:hypothetical protein